MPPRRLRPVTAIGVAEYSTPNPLTVAEKNTVKQVVTVGAGVAAGILFAAGVTWLVKKLTA
jgi:hypothetical protein